MVKHYAIYRTKERAAQKEGVLSARINSCRDVLRQLKRKSPLIYQLPRREYKHNQFLKRFKSTRGGRYAVFAQHIRRHV